MTEEEFTQICLEKLETWKFQTDILNLDIHKINEHIEQIMEETFPKEPVEVINLAKSSSFLAEIVEDYEEENGDDEARLVELVKNELFEGTFPELSESVSGIFMSRNFIDKVPGSKPLTIYDDQNLDIPPITYRLTRPPQPSLKDQGFIDNGFRRKPKKKK